MQLLRVETWLKSPTDREVIARWTVGAGQGMSYALDLPVPPDPDNFTFLALGDTGDSEATGPKLSPQDAVAREMASDAALPSSQGNAELVLHTGDVIYMTGERRLYDRNFRQPYAPFLAPQSTVDNLVFRIPFLPVPGNHDYYDLNGWIRWLSRLPILGAGIRAISGELFAFSLPEGGSDMGKAYMEAFVQADANTLHAPLIYRPNEHTRLPNRYYKFRRGSVDFIALDSNTLDAPPPGTDKAQIHADADQRLEMLEVRAKELDRQLRKQQLMLEKQRETAYHEISHDGARRQMVSQASGSVGAALLHIQAVVQAISPPAAPCQEAHYTLERATRRWHEAYHDLSVADEASEVRKSLRELEEASDDCCQAMTPVEGCLAGLPEGQARTELLGARDRLQRDLRQWSESVAPTPTQETAILHQLSEEAMDVQRELTLQRRRLRYRPEDFDTEQLAWFEQSLARSVAERPDNWRVVSLHHPLYTSITNHCERPDVQGLRANLLAILQKYDVHLVLSGHSHTFEWFRSEALPTTGIFVTGGGGQISLRPSIFEPSRRSRYREYAQSLVANGVAECTIGGRGPSAADGESGMLYHYLRIAVTPDALIVTPVGVRRLSGFYRREEPMPVYHVPNVAANTPAWSVKNLESIVVRRGQKPQPTWK